MSRLFSTLLLLPSLFLQTGCHTTTENQVPVALPGTGIVNTENGQKIRIMAANTTSGRRPYYEDPGVRIFQGLRPDIVLIQEFNYGNNTTEDLNNFIATTFGPDFRYFREPGTKRIPNGVISRWPIEASGVWDDPKVSDREYAWARIDVPGNTDLWAVSVHFKSGRRATTRREEADKLVEYINNANIPEGDYLVIGGDLNTRNTNEAALRSLRTVVKSQYQPADRNGNIKTNKPRSKPYDWVMPDEDLLPHHIAVRIGSKTYNNGLVFDSRVYQPLSDVSPVQYSDSGAEGMQHMAVVKDYRVPVP